MNFELSAWLSKWKAAYGKLESRQRRNVWLIGVFLFLVIVLLSVFLLNPNYEVVFSNLDSKSAGEITQKLDQMKIAYQLQGTSILVPAAEADKVRVDMAMVGLPSSGYVDYSQILQQNSGLGLTSQELDLQTLNILEQRIAENISAIDGIENAQVNIVMPQQSDFLDPSTNSSAKASVFVTVGAGATLSPSQVSGIAQLVAHAVQGLSASDVSVVDQYGNDLSTGATSSVPTGIGASAVTQEIAVRDQLQNELQQSLMGSLGKLVGPANVSVNVHANVTFNQVAQQRHTVTAGPPLSAQASSASTTGATSGTAGGTAGQATQNPNIVSYGSGSGGTGGSSTNRSSTTNYDNSDTNTQTTFDPMQISGFTVSVLVNTTAVPLSPALAQQIKSFVQTAVGQTANAGSTVTVMGAPFAPGQGGLSSQTTAWYSSPLVLGSLLLLAVAGIAAAILTVRSRNRKRITADALGSLSAASLTSPPSQPAEAGVARELQELALKRPEAFASLLRGWLSEE